MTIRQIILLPISLLYGLAIGFNELLYATGLLRGFRFDLPVIVIGNLSTGGTGKTPHVEYVTHLLYQRINVAVMSRGYKRKTKGFRYVEMTDQAVDVGDEPLLIKRRFRSPLVVVAEDRVSGIMQLVSERSETQAIILDDGLQHRSLEPGLRILLTRYDRPFTKDWLLPSGDLREFRSGANRADIIIVTKTPETLTQEERQAFLKTIKPQAEQLVVMSRYRYGNPYHIYRGMSDQIADLSSYNVLLVVGIAHPDGLIKRISSQAKFVHALEFGDHHRFTEHDMGRIHKAHDSLGENTIILTTEKDTMRLDEYRAYIQQHNLPFYALPIQVSFDANDGRVFDERVISFLRDFKV